MRRDGLALLLVSCRTFGHEGEDEGASTGLYLDVATGRGAVVLANGDAFTSNDAPVPERSPRS